MKTKPTWEKAWWSCCTWGQVERSSLESRPAKSTTGMLSHEAIIASYSWYPEECQLGHIRTARKLPFLQKLDNGRLPGVYENYRLRQWESYLFCRTMGGFARVWWLIMHGGWLIHHFLTYRVHFWINVRLIGSHPEKCLHRSLKGGVGSIFRLWGSYFFVAFSSHFARISCATGIIMR